LIKNIRTKNKRKQANLQMIFSTVLQFISQDKGSKAP